MASARDDRTAPSSNGEDVRSAPGRPGVEGTEALLASLIDIAELVRSSRAFTPALLALVERLAQLQAWDVAEAWVLAADGRTIELGASWVRDGSLEDFVADERAEAYRPGRGMIREVWQHQAPVWHADLHEVPAAEVPRLEAAKRHGITSAALVPVVAGERTLAVAALFSRLRREPDEIALRFASAAVAQVAWLLERRVQQREVAAVSDRFRLISENARDIVSLHGEAGSYLWVSPSSREVVGYGPEELAGRSPAEFIHPDDADATLAALRRQAAEEGSRVPPYRFRRKDGSYLWLETTARAVPAGPASAARIVATSRDIDAHVKDRQALTASRRAFLRLFEDNPLPMFVYDVESLAFMEVNEAAVTQYGYSREEFLSRSIVDVRPEEDRARIVEHVRRERQALERMGVWRHLLADGTVVDVEVDSHATVFGGRAARLVVARDVTERKRLERERERRSEQLGRLAEAAVAIHGAAGTDEVLQQVTDAARVVLGAHQAIASMPEGVPLGVHSRFRTSLSERYAAYRDYEVPPSGEGIYRLVAESRKPMRLTQAEIEAHPAYHGFGSEAGTHPPLVGWLAAPMLGLDGQVLGIVQVSDRDGGDFTDDDEAMLVQLAQVASVALEKVSLLERVREQAGELERRVEERTAQLREANRDLEGFSYSVSHDLRAPLRAIDGFSSAVLEDYAARLDPQGRHYLQRVRAGAQQMGVLIDDLLTLSRVGRSALEPRDLDLAEIAREVEAELREAEPERAVEVTVPAGLPVRGDRTLLKVVLQNLIGNAWKFTARAEEARIEVSTDGDAGEIIYTVSDNGAGFDMRYLDKLFRPFQRLHAAETYPGTGVGLATVQRIVQRHGGRVWAEGEVGRGAAFHFTLGEGSV